MGFDLGGSRKVTGTQALYTIWQYWQKRWGRLHKVGARQGWLFWALGRKHDMIYVVFQENAQLHFLPCAPATGPAVRLPCLLPGPCWPITEQLSS